MSNSLKIGLVGATGALGGAVLDALVQAPWAPEVRAFARASTKVPAVAMGEDMVPVDDVADLDLASLDVLVVAVPRQEAGPLVDAAAEAGCPVVDCAGSRLEDLNTPLLGPGGLSAGGDEATSDVITLPSAAGWLLAAVMGSVAREASLRGAEATVWWPASGAGRDGIEELSAQVVSLFNSKPPPRKVFPHGLAFDLLPMLGVPTASGWTDTELRVVAEVARLTGIRADVTLVGVPVFSGMSASVRLEADGALAPDEVARWLSAGGIGLEVGVDGRTLPRPRRVEGQDAPVAARLRRGSSGRALHVWAAHDNLRVMGRAAVEATTLLLQRRGLWEG